MGNAPVDAVTVEVVRAALNAAAERMRITMIKTAYIIGESLDFGCALFDPADELAEHRPPRLLCHGDEARGRGPRRRRVVMLVIPSASGCAWYWAGRLRSAPR
jgi:hypothetical protein